jgi:hypothetical protein
LWRPRPTAFDAKTFIDNAEQRLLALNIDSGRADRIKSTYITDDTEDIAAKLDQRAIDAQVDYSKQSTRFAGLALDPETARKIQLLLGRNFLERALYIRLESRRIAQDPGRDMHAGEVDRVNDQCGGKAPAMDKAPAFDPFAQPRQAPGLSGHLYRQT